VLTARYQRRLSFRPLIKLSKKRGAESRLCVTDSPRPMLFHTNAMWRNPCSLSETRECLMQREMLSGCSPRAVPDRETVDKRIKGSARLEAADMHLRHVQLPRGRGSFRGSHLPEQRSTGATKYRTRSEPVSMR